MTRPVIPDEPLRLAPVAFAAAVEFVGEWHRHHAPPIGHKFSIGVALGAVLVGVIIVGRPVARSFDNGTTLEVLRWRHRRHPQRLIDALRRCLAGCKRNGLPPTDHVHAGRRGRRITAGRRVARRGGTTGPARLDDAQPPTSGPRQRAHPAIPLGGLGVTTGLTHPDEGDEHPMNEPNSCPWCETSHDDRYLCDPVKAYLDAIVAKTDQAIAKLNPSAETNDRPQATDAPTERRNVHCSNCGNTRGGPLGHETSECTWRAVQSGIANLRKVAADAPTGRPTTDPAGLDEAACTAAVKAVRWASDTEWQDRPTILARALTAAAPHIRKAALLEAIAMPAPPTELGDVWMRQVVINGGTAVVAGTKRPLIVLTGVDGDGKPLPRWTFIATAQDLVRVRNTFDRMCSLAIDAARKP